MSRRFSETKYPNLYRLDCYVSDFLSRSETKDLDSEEVELGICRIHPVYWGENYGWIEQGFLDTTEGSPTEVQLVPFKLNSVQLSIADRLCAHLEPGNWERIKAIVLKFRKAGISTLMAMFDYWFMKHIDNCGAFIIADKNAHTDNIFNMVVRFFEKDVLPKPYRVPMFKNKYGLRFSNGAMLETDSGETKHPGTSQTLQILHMSENSKWAQILDAEVSLLNSIPRKGFAWIIKESTAFGLNKYANDCLAALDKKSDWIFIFISWADLDDCSIKLENGEILELSLEEKELIDTYSLSHEQIKFRRSKINELQSIRKFKQDFPIHPREPFYEGKSNYFNVELVEDRKDEIEFFACWKQHGYDAAIDQFPTISHHINAYKDASSFLREIVDKNIIPRKIQISEVQGKVTYKSNEELDENQGYVTMWRDPQRSSRYLVTVDPAEGLSSDDYTSDNSVVEVFDCDKREQVAEFAGVYDEEVTSRFAVLLALLYNKAPIAVEINNKCGGVVLTYIQERYKYYNLYYSQKITKHQQISRELGWRTSSANKKEVCSQLKIDFKNDDCILHSVPLLIEMLNFVEEKAKLKAGTGHTDDRIMASAIALKIIDTTPGLGSMRPSEVQYQLERSFPIKKNRSYLSEGWREGRQSLDFPESTAPQALSEHGRTIKRLNKGY